MSPQEEQEIKAVMARIPALAAQSGAITRLGGLTNRVYAVGTLVLRIPGKGTEDYINRSHEMIMAQEAAKAGVSPAVIFCDAASGIMVTERIADATTLSPAGFSTIPGAVERAAEALRKLHCSGAQFPSRFDLFAMIDGYLKIIGSKDVALPDGYDDVVQEAQTLRGVLDKNAIALVPCHCDPLCENFLDTGKRMWIVDWEYGGMNDPMWDLGDLSVEGHFSPTQDEALLQAYFGERATAQEHGRMVIYKAMCDLLWTLWGLVQHANGNPADDFQAYAENRFSRCKALMATTQFATHVKAVTGD